ncbi:MAG: type 1 glutamine amidotransferase [Planctomycetaceae bacterium]|nr:type 1 glutamine amidotransferase [Planctomycetaceae bacterium]
MLDKVRYLLLQIRNPDDPMRSHEVECFSRALKTTPAQIAVLDLLNAQPSAAQLAETDVVLLGGSGHYSVVDETSVADPPADWLRRALDVMRNLHERRQPTFASCWGFQAMARALGGRVIHDATMAEIGTHELTLTPAGHEDPIFGPLSDQFLGQMGHEDHVIELPPNATLLASTGQVTHQAYRLDDAPIYCTQFHPELNRSDLLRRLDAYPEYIRHLTGMSIEEFASTVKDASETEALLPRFVKHVLS